MSYIYQYIENQSEFEILVNIKDTNKNNLLNKILSPGKKEEFHFHFSNKKNDFNHVKELYLELKNQNSLFTSLFSANEIGIGLDLLFNAYPKTLIYFDTTYCSFSLAAADY
ncbi:hypothetical protein Xmau_02834 [Xenorhabdus mauleonii]|uniref:Uncharacterized protein n=1 Tax=Xenorhabdus mauleonii TaxID=351675 RepID=A0A1I3IFX4_9GAMM|nr:hypothetical protein [Xenorhabdus mauleonii]PHM39486.1 hypothetical protein Xmau_02834 [Xenorhabdus mauleonii]SFI46868.1 hypothetical protein SAMN05421680_101330 [Xenorhabdus mauleonii]